jgi:hypothetical protein
MEMAEVIAVVLVEVNWDQCAISFGSGVYLASSVKAALLDAQLTSRLVRSAPLIASRGLSEHLPVTRLGRTVALPVPVNQNDNEVKGITKIGRWQQSGYHRALSNFQSPQGFRSMSWRASRLWRTTPPQRHHAFPVL